MSIVPVTPPPSVYDLQREWLTNLGRTERVTHRGVVERLLDELSMVPPTPFYDLLALQPWQLIKKRRLNRYYPALQVFVWQKALETTHPLYTARIIWLFRRIAPIQRPADRHHLAAMDQQLALFALLTDNVIGDGFTSIALYVVSRVLGGWHKNPTQVILAVQLADQLDQWFETRMAQFAQMDLLP